ncbi:MAG: hypothetical protein J6S44_00295, partial [Clostridia bacterium]|nr:hypothetical protein [Clostridia bacterium]
EKRFNSIHHNFVALEDIAFYDQIGYYLDGAASNWDVYDNVADNCGTALYIQHNINLGPQHTHHNHVTRFYSTTPVAETNHTPARDVYLKECYVETEGLDTLFERYPAAREIYENSGSRH